MVFLAKIMLLEVVGGVDVAPDSVRYKLWRSDANLPADHLIQVIHSRLHGRQLPRGNKRPQERATRTDMSNMSNMSKKV